jgi:hypothetical protein
MQVPARLCKKKFPLVKNNQREKFWMTASSDRAPDLQAQKPEFKPEYCQKERKRKKEGKHQ